jgi:hypothetical protein
MLGLVTWEGELSVLSHFQTWLARWVYGENHVFASSGDFCKSASR